MNPMENMWSVVCNKTLTNPETGTISLIDVVEKVTIGLSLENQTGEAIKELHGKISADMHLVSFFKIHDQSTAFYLKVQLVTPKGDKHQLFEQRYQLPTEQRNFRHNLHIRSFFIDGDGVYYLKTESKMKKSDEYEEVSKAEVHVVIDIKS